MIKKQSQRKEKADMLREAMLFSLTRSSWSNRAHVDKNVLTGNATNESVNVTKRLLKSPDLKNINDFLGEIYVWCLSRAVPSTAIRNGIYFVKQDQVKAFEAKLSSAQKYLMDTLVPEFLSTYDDARRAAQKPASEGGLGDLFNEKDYPDPEELESSFGLNWSWLALSVPDELPEEVRERECAKLQESYDTARGEITLALRVAFQELVKHAADRLTPDADGKGKIFRAGSMLENFENFFETFSARNLLEDADLEKVVNQARAIISGVPDADALRADESLQHTVGESFKAVAKTLDSLVERAKVRKFDFSV